MPTKNIHNDGITFDLDQEAQALIERLIIEETINRMEPITDILLDL